MVWGFIILRYDGAKTDLPYTLHPLPYTSASAKNQINPKPEA